MRIFGFIITREPERLAGYAEMGLTDSYCLGCEAPAHGAYCLDPDPFSRCRRPVNPVSGFKRAKGA